MSITEKDWYLNMSQKSCSSVWLSILHSVQCLHRPERLGFLSPPELTHLSKSTHRHAFMVLRISALDWQAPPSAPLVLMSLNEHLVASSLLVSSYRESLRLLGLYKHCIQFPQFISLLFSSFLSSLL